MRRSDAAVLPVIESDRDFGVAGTHGLRDPNRAVQVDPSASLLQLIMLAERSLARMLGRIDDIQSRKYILRDDVLIDRPGKAPRSNPCGAKTENHIFLPINRQLFLTE